MNVKEEISVACCGALCFLAGGLGGLLACITVINEWGWLGVAVAAWIAVMGIALAVAGWAAMSAAEKNEDRRHGTA